MRKKRSHSQSRHASDSHLRAVQSTQLDVEQLEQELLSRDFTYTSPREIGNGDALRNTGKAGTVPSGKPVHTSRRPVSAVKRSFLSDKSSFQNPELGPLQNVVRTPATLSASDLSSLFRVVPITSSCVGPPRSDANGNAAAASRAAAAAASRAGSNLSRHLLDRDNNAVIKSRQRSCRPKRTRSRSSGRGAKSKKQVIRLPPNSVLRITSQSALQVVNRSRANPAVRSRFQGSPRQTTSISRGVKHTNLWRSHRANSTSSLRSRAKSSTSRRSKAKSTSSRRASANRITPRKVSRNSSHYRVTPIPISSVRSILSQHSKSRSSVGLSAGSMRGRSKGPGQSGMSVSSCNIEAKEDSRNPVGSKLSRHISESRSKSAMSKSPSSARRKRSIHRCSRSRSSASTARSHSRMSLRRGARRLSRAALRRRRYRRQRRASKASSPRRRASKASCRTKTGKRLGRPRGRTSVPTIAGSRYVQAKAEVKSRGLFDRVSSLWSSFSRSPSPTPVPSRMSHASSSSSSQSWVSRILPAARAKSSRRIQAKRERRHNEGEGGLGCKKKSESSAVCAIM